MKTPRSSFPQPVGRFLRSSFPQRLARFLFLTIMVFALGEATAQVRSAAPKGVLRGLVPDKWQVQHYHSSYDGRTMLISALAPGEKHYDLYILTATRGVWTKPLRLGEDE